MVTLIGTMQQWIGVLLFISMGGLLFLFLTFKPTPDAYTIITSLGSTSNLVSQATLAESSSSSKSLVTTGNVVNTVTARHHKVFQVNVKSSESPSREQSLNITNYTSIPVRGGENIFFIESSCAVGGNRTSTFMNPRQGCAVESAALANPSATIYFLNTCLAGKEFKESHPTYDKVVREVFKYPNVRSYYVELASYFSNTPLNEWISKGELKHSKYPVEHTSDILRLVTLWKFGGIYLDLDFVILRSLANLEKDFTVAESDELIGNSVLSFSADGMGHEVVDKCLKDLLHHFDGQEWGYNGPFLITRVMSRLCNGVPVQSMTPENCKGFTVHHPSLFFPFYYPSWNLLFNEEASNSTMALVLKNGTYGTHAWNKMSHASPIKVGSKQPYALLASRFCPRVYSAVGETF